jgi:hypothetical protein
VSALDPQALAAAAAAAHAARAEALVALAERHAVLNRWLRGERPEPAPEPEPESEADPTAAERRERRRLAQRQGWGATDAGRKNADLPPGGKEQMESYIRGGPSTGGMRW